MTECKRVNLCVLDAMDADLGSWFWIVHHSTFCCLLELFTLIVFMICHRNCYRCHSGGYAAAQHVLDTCAFLEQCVGPVAPNTPQMGSQRRTQCSWQTVHAIRPFASCELNSCSVSAVPSWQHFYRPVLHDLDIEFEPRKEWTRHCSYHGLTLPQSATSCSCASSTCAIASQPISSPRAPSSRSRLLQT